MVEATTASRKHDGTQCRGCGAFVSARFTRVFGDNDDEVYGCHECMPSSELFGGGSVEAD